MALFTCRAVLLDLDGVLVDSTPCVTRVWTTWAKEQGLDPEYVVHVAHGQKAIETIRTVAPHVDFEREMKKVEQMELDDTDGLRRLPGASELLKALSAGRYTIVTSGTRRLAIMRLKIAGLPVPANMVTADDVANGKPHPEPYLAGAAAVGVAACDCLVFEDAPSGIHSAKAAGTQVIGISTTYSREQLDSADLVVPSLGVVGVRRAEGNSHLILEISVDSE